MPHTNANNNDVNATSPDVDAVNPDGRSPMFPPLIHPSSQSTQRSTSGSSIRQTSPKSTSEMTSTDEIIKSLDAVIATLKSLPLKSTTSNEIKKGVADAAKALRVTKTLVSCLVRQEPPVPASQLPTDAPSTSAELAAVMATLMSPLLDSVADMSRKLDATQRDVEALKRPIQSTPLVTETSQEGATYAKVAKKTKFAGSSGDAADKSKKKTQNVKPQEKKVKYGIIVKSTDDSVSQEDAQKLFKKKINLVEYNCGVSRISSLSNKLTRYDFEDSASRDAILSAVNNLTDLKAELPKARRPTLIMKGVSSDVTKEMLVDAIIKQNKTVSDVIKSQDVNDHITVTYTEKRRYKGEEDTSRVNYILEVSHDVKDVLLKLGRVNVSYQRIHVEVRSTFLQCFKCFGFGHTTKFCKASVDVCGHCSENGHRHKDCPNKDDKDKIKCVNCVKSNLKHGKSDATSHVPMNAKCPHVATMMRKASQRTHNV